MLREAARYGSVNSVVYLLRRFGEPPLLHLLEPTSVSAKIKLGQILRLPVDVCKFDPLQLLRLAL